MLSTGDGVDPDAVDILTVVVVADSATVFESDIYPEPTLNVSTTSIDPFADAF